MSEALTAAQIVQLIQEKEAERSHLQQQQLRLQLQLENEQEAQKRLEAEMVVLGTSPETIDQDLAQAEADLTSDYLSYDKSLQDFRKGLQEAEAAAAQS